MPSRFLTAEDVRRARAPEIVVEPGTVVTPQALELAEASGIVIRTERGAYVEPAPDRGPDADHQAERTLAAMPGLPEPEDDPHAGVTVVVTAVGRNRHGVLAEITSTINGTGGSVETVSQRVVEGFFHLILVVNHDGPEPFDELKRCLECLGGADDYVVHVMHERVYRFMHRI
jgi:ACT domain-containing protein